MREDLLHAEYERLFAELARRVRHAQFAPNADVYVDREQARIVVHVELAGVDADSLRVGIDEQHLFIIGSRTHRHGASGSMYQKEIQYGEFVKKLHLPAPVDEEHATAVYRDGILTIGLPLAPHAAFSARRTEIRMVVQRTPA